MTKMTMGLAKQSTEQDTTSDFQGIVGVGFDVGEAIYSQTQTATQAGITYPNIISQLVSQSFIKTRAYSLWLNDKGKARTRTTVSFIHCPSRYSQTKIIFFNLRSISRKFWRVQEMGSPETYRYRIQASKVQV